jgi:hypothetical protein
VKTYPPGTRWLQAIRAILTLLLVSDVLVLLLSPTEHVSSVGSVSTGVMWSGDAYVHRQLPELEVSRVAVGLDLARDNHLIDYSLGQKLLYLMSHRLAFILVSIPMLILARRVVATAIHSDPFTPDMVRRLRVLGLAVLIGGALSEAAEYVCAQVLLRMVVPKQALFSAEPDVRITLWWLLPAFILLAVAEVVRRGVAMRAELDTVI